MQTCTICRAQSPDDAKVCVNCGADLPSLSTTSVALEDFRTNSRVNRIRLIVAHDACPACCNVEGEFEKDLVPNLPVHGCSHPLGCRCFYEPSLVEIYP